MSNIPAIQSAMTGIQSGISKINRNAADIASQSVAGDAADLTRSLIDMRQNQLQVEASIKVVKTSNEVLGSLLDVKA
ncbi:hypothetical protein [Methylophaga lonarensis]|nr:hypothetical protein [Methylophaga lonarensis]MCC5796591.1 hypothetical protein [Methylophaga sp.]